MFTSLPLVAALAFAPAQAGTFTISNIRTTYGELGSPRPDSRYLPGDLFFLAFDIDGLKIGPDGKVSYRMQMVVVDKTGKPILQPMPGERDEYLPLGGTKLPGRAFVILELNQAPGTYTCKLTVTDRATNANRTLEKAFEVLPKSFGLVGLFCSADQKGETPAPPLGVVGQNLHIHALIVGFARTQMKQPDTIVEMRLFDEARRPTLATPFTTSIPKDLNAMEELVTVYFLVPFNREGNFTAEIKATDRVTNKVSTISFPVRVMAPAR